MEQEKHQPDRSFPHVTDLGDLLISTTSVEPSTTHVDLRPPLPPTGLQSHFSLQQSPQRLSYILCPHCSHQIDVNVAHQQQQPFNVHSSPSPFEGSLSFRSTRHDIDSATRVVEPTSTRRNRTQESVAPLAEVPITLTAREELNNNYYYYDHNNNNIHKKIYV